MKAEELIKAQENIREILEKKLEDLQQLKTSQDSLASRWQKFIEMIIPVQFSEIRTLLYPGNQDGLSKFNMDVIEMSKSHPKLGELNAEKWTFLLKNAFGISEYKELSLEKAQQITQDLSEAMQTSSFLMQVDKLINPQYLALPMMGKRKFVLDLLAPVYMSVFKKYGFEGDSGYILAQRALMDYHSDPYIKGNLNAAQFKVFSRAKLI
jgi:hypothetical protein